MNGATFWSQNKLCLLCQHMYIDSYTVEARWWNSPELLFVCCHSAAGEKDCFRNYNVDSSKRLRALQITTIECCRIGNSTTRIAFKYVIRTTYLQIFRIIRMSSAHGNAKYLHKQPEATQHNKVNEWIIFSSIYLSLCTTLWSFDLCSPSFRIIDYIIFLHCKYE